MQGQETLQSEALFTLSRSHTPRAPYRYRVKQLYTSLSHSTEEGARDDASCHMPFARERLFRRMVNDWWIGHVPDLTPPSGMFLMSHMGRCPSVVIQLEALF